MKREKKNLDTNPPSELNEPWPRHRPADLLDRVIVEQWLDSQVALIGGAGLRRPGTPLRPSS